MSLSFAMVTPSFAPDFERCRLLADSVVRYAAPSVKHYIVVDRRDEALFGALRGPRTEIVCKQDVLPSWLHQVPRTTRWWVDTKRPGVVRGWVVQQLIKLMVSELCAADAFVFADSDTFLMRSYDPSESVRDGRVPMFRELLPSDDDPHNVEWHRVAARLFGLTPLARYRTNYVTQLLTWRRDNLLAMRAQIERTTGREWAASICACRTVSEYALYGVFCEQVLKEDRSGHYWDDRIDALLYWKTTPLGESALRELRTLLRPEHRAVMISAKSNTPVPLIRRVFELAD